MRLFLNALLSCILFISLVASPVSAQDRGFDGVYEISFSRVFLKNTSVKNKGTKQLMAVANVEVRGTSVRFLELTTNNARVGRGIVFRGFQGSVNQSGVLSFSTRVSIGLLVDEDDATHTLKVVVPLKVPTKVGNTVSVLSKDFNPRYGGHVSVKTLKLYNTSQSNVVASNKPATTSSAPQSAVPKNSRNELKSVIQPLLAELGYYTGAIDGIAGRQTDRAIAAFENTVAGRDDGFLDAGELSALTAAAEARRQTASVPQPNKAENSVSKLQAENERLKLELENARLRQELEAAKQQLQPASEVTVDAVEPSAAIAAPSQTVNAVTTDAMTTNFDGLYKPRGEQFSHWDCSSVGQDGGALAIDGNRMTLIEEACTLTDARQVAGSDAVSFNAQCAVEGTEYEAQVALRKTDFGVVFSGDEFSAEWLSCDAEEAERVAVGNETAPWVTEVMDCYLEVRREVKVDDRCSVSYDSADPSFIHFDSEGDNLSHINISGDGMSAWNGGIGYRVTTPLGVMIPVGGDCYASGSAKVCFGTKTAADLAYERQKAEELAAEKAEAERVAAEKAEAERLAAEKAEAERLAAKRAEAERLAAKKEAERLAAEKVEAERLAEEKIMADRLAALKDRKRLAEEKDEAERVAAEQALSNSDGSFLGSIYNIFFGDDDERLAAEKAEAERLTAEKAKAERLAAEKAEAERLAAEKANQDRYAALQAEKKRRAAAKAKQRKAANQLRTEQGYTAYLTCEHGGRHINIMPCMKDTDLKVTRDGIAKIYKPYDIANGRQTQRGYVFSLPERFEVIAQNSHETLVLGLTIEDAGGQVVFQDQVGTWGVIRVRE